MVAIYAKKASLDAWHYCGALDFGNGVDGV